ncbi:hypothetical protein BDV06DRAFT_235611 [Aspergillus oleicola]
MDHPLRVTIVGGGLAGLLVARVLRERHTVTLVEKLSGGHEIGAAISIGPNGVNIIEQLGFDQSQCQSVVCGETRTLDRHGELLGTKSMAYLKETYGAHWLFQHRADLWNQFLRLATGPLAEIGIPGEPANILWGTEVVNVDVESGDVFLSDGRKLESNLVIIIRPLVIAEEAFRTARPSGSSAFRFTVPRDILDKHKPGLRVMDPAMPGALEIHLSLDGSTRSVIMYPCRGFELLNIGCITPDTILQSPPRNLLRCFHDFSPLVRDILGLADGIKVWQLRDQDPLPTYTRGRVILVGDAAHSLTPHQGQGCNQAIEDAEGFRLFTERTVSRDQVTAMLKDFDRVRRPRASQIQNHTRQAHHKASAEDLWRYTDYNYTYPGVVECLRRLDAGDEMIHTRQRPAQTEVKGKN